MQRQDIDGRGIFLEFQRVGDYVKVSAIEAETNVEISIVGSPRTTQQQLTRLAVRKLEYVLGKTASSREHQTGPRLQSVNTT